MTTIMNFKKTMCDILKLSLPILGGNLSQILIGLSDTIIAGRYSTLALGAVSVASAIVMTLTIGAIGLILSISPVIANLRGAGIKSKKYFKLSILFAIFVSIPFLIILELFILKIDSIGLAPDLVIPVKTYLGVCAWSIIPIGIFCALKEFLQAFENVVFANLLMFFMVFLNLILNVIFAFGYSCPLFSIPEMGVFGLALATTISKTLSALFMVLYCLPLFFDKFNYSKRFLKDLIKTGYPISIAMFMEFLGFNLTAVLIGKFSALFAGVHNIVLSVANMTFMICLSVSSATSIKIGLFNGKKDKKSIIEYSIASIAIILTICLISFIILSFGADNIIQLFSKDPEVLALAKQILVFAMCFLFFDGFQCACVGVLKGLKDTKIIMIAMCSGYLLIAIPLGSYLAFYHNHVLDGYWLGLACALFMVSLITGFKLVWDIKRLKY